MLRHLVIVVVFIFIGGFVNAQDKSFPKKKGDIFYAPDVPATFPGGEDSIYAFLANKIRYPSCGMGCIEGDVYAEFIVDTNGTLLNPKIVRPLADRFDNEVLRVIRLMPNWIPAYDDGKKVKMSFVLPVSFE